MYFEIRKQKYLEALDRYPPHPLPLGKPNTYLVSSSTMSTGWPVMDQVCQQEGSHRRHQDLEEGLADLPGAESRDFQ